ncbi:MAG: isopeptide-forming domain-containing fimbrial protein, partial [Planctomycetota bacterium]
SEINQTYTTSAEVTGYGTVDGGANHAIGLAAGTLVDDASVDVLNVALSKSIVATSEAHTGFVSGIERVAIGEIVRYRLVTEIPEGTLADTIIRERLRNGLMFLDDGTATIAFVSNNGIVSTNGAAGLSVALGTPANVVGNSVVAPTFLLDDVNVGSSASLSNDVDNFNNGTDAFFKLGTIVNNDNDADAEFVVIEFNALVVNNAANDRNDLLRNDFQVSIDPNGPGGGRRTLRTSNQANVRVVEPRIDNLSINASPTGADAGDIVDYTIAFNNDGGSTFATAFDARLQSTLPPELSLLLGTINVMSSGTVVGVTNNSAGNNLDIQFDEIAAGASVTVTFQATLSSAVEPEETLSTPTSITYTSLPGTGTPNGIVNTTGSSTPSGSGLLTGERDGSGGVNDYRDTDSAEVTVFSPTLDKTLVSTSVINATNGVAEATIGELVTYQLVLGIPEGTMDGAFVVDNLAAGLAFVSLDSVVFDGDIATDRLAPVSAAVTGQQLRFDLGNLLNSASDTNAETITLRYTARVDNVAGNQGEAAGTTLPNSAVLNWDLDGTTRSTPSDSVTVTVIEPDLELLYSVSPDPVDAGDTLTFQLVVRHAVGSDTDAYDVTLSEVFDSELGNITIVSATHSASGDVSGDFSFTAGTNTVATNNANGFDLGLGETLTLIVSANVNQIANPAATLSGNADVRWTSLDGAVGGERTGVGAVDDYRDTAVASVTVIQPTITKTLTGTSINVAANDNTEVVIGEMLQYTVTVVLPESTMDLAQINDTLGAGLAFVSLDSVRVLSGGAPTALVTSSLGSFGNTALFDPLVSGQNLTFSLGQIVNADNANSDLEVLEITYTVRAENTATNQQGTTLDNRANYSWNQGGTPRSTADATAASVTVLEPTLQIDHSISPGAGDAFDTVTYTSTINHTGTSDADAFDTTYSATFSPDLTVGSFSVVDSNLTDLTSRFELVAGNVLRTRVGQSFDIGLTESVTVQLTGTIDADVQPNDVLDSDAAIAWTSLDGASVQERDGSDGAPTSGSAPLNNYSASDGEAFTVSAVTLSKSLVGTSVNDASNANDEVVIGELVQYELVVELPEGQTNGTLILDSMDVGLEFVSLISVVGSGGVSSTIDAFGNTGSFAPSISGDGRTTPQTLTFDLGDLTNANADNGVNETVTLTYSARVTNIAGNTSNGSATGVILDEVAQLQYNHRGTTETTPTVTAANVEVIEPQLEVRLSVDDPTPHLGQVVQYTITIDHAAGSNASAHDLRLTNVLPTGLTLIGSPTVTGGTVGTSIPTTNGFDLFFDTLRVTDSVTVQYNAQVTSDLSAIGSNLQTDPAITWTSLPDGIAFGVNDERDGDSGNGGEDDYDDADSLTVRVTHPLVEVTQTTVGTDVSSFGNQGNFEITYDLTVTSTGNDPLTAVNLTEDFRDLFGTGFVGIVGTPVITSSSADDDIELNANYDGGLTDSNLIDNSAGNTNRLQQGESFTVRLTVQVDPDAAGANLTDGNFVGQASASSVGEDSGQIAVDLSDDPSNGADVELDATADSEGDDPNRHRFPLLTVTKSIVGSPTVAGSGAEGNFDVTYQIVLENDGSTPLINWTLTEDLASHFGASFIGIVGAPTIASTAIDPPDLNGGFTGRAGGTALFDASPSRLEINETVTVTLVVEIDPDAVGGNRDSTTGQLDNQAVATAFDPQDLLTTIADASDDPGVGDNVDPNNDNNPDDPTPLLLPRVVLVKDTVGAPTPATSGIAGNYEVVFELTVTNQGNEPLEQLSLLQDFQNDYGGAFVGLVGTPVILGGATASDLPELNASYDGTSANNQLIDNGGTNTNELAAGESFTVRLTVQFDPNAVGANLSGGDLVSQATAAGTGTQTSTVVTDLSDDPDDVTESDPDFDIDTDDPNRVRVPLLSLTKQVIGLPIAASSGVAGNFDVVYEFVVRNEGTTPLENLSLLEDLGSHFGSAFIGLVGTPTLDATGVASPPSLNGSFAGTGSDIELIDQSSANRLEVNESVSIRLVVE